ncbi:MAG: lysine 5,6-aminomutase subunit alpha [Spirochaetales bacterium]|nr:lysine 5,6-aminomutase subunit alpha [Spirochaetales bacterium]
MKSKLNINEDLVKSCRDSAGAIAGDVQAFIDTSSTIAVERTVCRLLGIDGVDAFDVPLPNVVIEALVENELIEKGCADFFARAFLATGKTAQDIAESISDDGFDFQNLPEYSREKKEIIINEKCREGLNRIKVNRNKRRDYLNRFGEKEGALLYVIVATGNIREDVVQAVAAAKQGADVIAVIRTTGQSLLDYVPYGETTDGFGGTYATQENFKIMRSALDDVGEELNRYIRLCNYCSGLCMPEIAAMGAFERLDMMLNDALYGILFRDINMKRTLIDQYFSRIINAYGEVIINTGEDNYLTTSDAYEEAHTVLASQFINEQFAHKAGLKDELIGLGHAYEIDPAFKNSFVYELAQAQMTREIFPEAPLKYMPPTKYLTGDVFLGNVQDALFNIVTTITGQRIHLLGMMTEAVHTPFMSDRAVAIENASYIARSMETLGEEITFKADGLMSKRANEVIGNAHELLAKIEETGMFKSLSQGVFGGVKRGESGGKGLKGVFLKAPDYMNPFIDLMLAELEEGLA